MHNLFVFVLILFIIVCIALRYSITEPFQNHRSGIGFQKVSENYPLFVNFYEPILAQDFELNSLIRRLKMNNINPTLFNGFERPLLIENTENNYGPSKCPVFIIPTIGASKIYGKWNKTENKYVKKLDSLGNFEETERWKCREIQDTWTELWYPDHNMGISEYCWSFNTKVDENFSNAQGVETAVKENEDFIRGYDTLVKSLYAISYIKNSTMFYVNYDFRRLSAIIDELCDSMQKKIEKYVQMNHKRAIIIGHGLGSLIANYFLVTRSQMWKDNNVAIFINISGTFLGSYKKQEGSSLLKSTIESFSGLQWLTPGCKDPKYLKSLESPNVHLYNMHGTNIKTVYEGDNIVDGDGTMSTGSLEFPMNWKNIYPSKLRKYENAEHVKILSLYEPIKDILVLVDKTNRESE